MATRMSVGQILDEAREISRQKEAAIRGFKNKITDSSELSDYRVRRRERFEEQIRRELPRGDMKLWMKYARWEDSHKEYDRARSVFERAMEGGFRNHIVWIKYAKMEMKNKFINFARDVWDRAVTYLPRVDQLWYEYILMEKELGNIAEARQIFERWMNLSPEPLDYIGNWRRREEINVEERSFKKQKVEG